MRFLHKHKFIFVAALMVFVLQADCARENAGLATQMPSSQISQKEDNTVVPTGTNEMNVTPTPLTIVPTQTPTVILNSTESPTVPSSTQYTQNTEMNFSQIQVGDYSSLLGTWKQLAYADNLFDGKGMQWHTGKTETLYSTLSVSIDKIDYNESTVIVQGNMLADGEGSHLISFESNGSSLDGLADSTTAIYWAISFYPKGVANNLEPNNDVQIDNTKNLIVIFYSGMRVLTVFAQE